MGAHSESEAICSETSLSRAVHCSQWEPASPAWLGAEAGACSVWLFWRVISVRTCLGLIARLGLGCGMPERLVKVTAFLPVGKSRALDFSNILMTACSLHFSLFIFFSTQDHEPSHSFIAGLARSADLSTLPVTLRRVPRRTEKCPCL
jgi:hypothetical protein